ncbi:MAG: BON domain-containing protein [Burkholderiales bacterium]|nr:BON domain-containing protein [Burkholderiales bacterium]MDE2452591.1 BON domain-containing protein [Burkholderiales bacterium]
MKLQHALAVLVLGAAVLPLATRAADSDADRRHPAVYVKDSVVTTKIKTKLAAEKMNSLANITVDTERGGAVKLGGTAHRQEDADRALSIARDTEGVKSVSSTIVVKQDD